MIASNKVDPQFVELGAPDADAEAEVDEVGPYVHKTMRVISRRGMESARAGCLIFDPYLVAIVPNNPSPGPHCHPCELKYRLAGFRSLLGRTNHASHLYCG